MAEKQGYEVAQGFAVAVAGKFGIDGVVAVHEKVMEVYEVERVGGGGVKL